MIGFELIIQRYVFTFGEIISLIYHYPGEQFGTFQNFISKSKKSLAHLPWNNRIILWDIHFQLDCRGLML